MCVCVFPCKHCVSAYMHVFVCVCGLCLHTQLCVCVCMCICVCVRESMFQSANELVCVNG